MNMALIVSYKHSCASMWITLNLLLILSTVVPTNSSSYNISSSDSSNNRNLSLHSTHELLHRMSYRLYKRSSWLPATATWYGSPDGDGSDGGACGYGNLAGSAYGTRVSAGSPVLFRNGEGCGACYQVRCMGVGALCARRPVRVVITDECPGGYCAGGRTHFDMSGSAFRRMAAGPGLAGPLLDAGLIHVLYRRVPCNFGRGRVPLAFQVNQGATAFWFSVLVRYEDGDGDLALVELMEADDDRSGEWKQMRQLWGAYWCINAAPRAMRGPFSMRITTSSGSTLTAQHVIPFDWAPGKIYSANVNFPLHH